MPSICKINVSPFSTTKKYSLCLCKTSFQSWPKCVKEPCICHDHNFIHNSILQEQGCLEILIYQIGEMEKILQNSLPHNITMTNIFEVLEVHVANKQGIKICVPKKLNDSIIVRFSIDMY
jgi:hypothetical protein